MTSAIGAIGGAFGASEFGGPGFELMVARTAIAAIAGCVGSSLSGGNCANGAITAAMAHLFNNESVMRWGA